MENSVWVYVENSDETVSDVSLELVGKGRELADQMNLPAASYGVSKLILFYPLTLTLSPGRGNKGLTLQQATGNYQVKFF